MSGDSSWLVTPGQVQDGRQECGWGAGGVTLQWGGRALKGKDGTCMYVTVHTCLQSYDWSPQFCVESPAM